MSNFRVVCIFYFCSTVNISLLVKLNFVLQFRQVREDSGISQEEVAHQIKLYRIYIGHLENEKYTPSVYTLYKITKF